MPANEAMTETELEDLINALKGIFGGRVKEARQAAGYSSQGKLADAALSFDSGTVRDIERAYSGTSFKKLVEISELTNTPIAFLFPTYMLSAGEDGRETEIDSLIAALSQLNVEDIKALRIMIERLAEYRREVEDTENG